MNWRRLHWRIRYEKSGILQSQNMEGKEFYGVGYLWPFVGIYSAMGTVKKVKRSEKKTSSKAAPSPSLDQRAMREDLAPFFKDQLEGFETPEDLRHSGDRQVDFAEALLNDAVRTGTSDIHFEPLQYGARVRFRIDGYVWDVAQLPPAKARVVLNQLKAMAEMDPVVRFNPHDAHATYKASSGPVDLRVALAPSPEGETMVIRLLDPSRLERSILELGLSQKALNTLNEWMDGVNGMFLAAGPTGSGKTTTLYSLLQELRTSNRIIVSLEDPVEYLIDGVTQIQIDMLHNLTFAEGAKSMLRLDPDFLMLGEIRDATSAATAVNTAISGRVLLSTIHSRDAVGAITSLRNWDLADHEIAESLSVVVAQRLVRRLCSECRQEIKPSAGEKAWLNSMRLPVPPSFFKEKGCQQCRNLGYGGRAGVFELWRLDEEDYSMILDGTDEAAIRAHLAHKGHHFFLEDAMEKVKEGLTSLDEVKRIASGVLPSRKRR
jgi:general secretion pathway protein E